MLALAARQDVDAKAKHPESEEGRQAGDAKKAVRKPRQMREQMASREDREACKTALPAGRQPQTPRPST